MKAIKVKASTSYEIFIERGLLGECGKMIKNIVRCNKTAVITDDTVNTLYGDTLEKTLTENGFTVCRYVFPHGEASKCSDTLNKIYAFLCENSITRSDCIVALGGGVVGDISGYAAATFLRGIKYIQIPTTLLAQIDSSVGGKTAIDLPQGKNLVGAFKQPECVICDPDVLSTLTEEILSDGMAEAIKYGMIRDSRLFDLIASHDITNVSDVIDDIIYKCVAIKRDVVENDEFDTGERMILNFGHTLGHSVESDYNYETYTHGSAVAIGMKEMTDRTCSDEVKTKLTDCIKAYRLPTGCDAPMEKLVKLCGGDKKRTGGDINFIVCEKIGEAEIRKLTVAEFEKFILETGK